MPVLTPAENVTMSSSVTSRALCEQAAHDAVMRWAAAFGLEGAWTFKTVLTLPEQEEALKESVACCEIQHVRRHATVKLHERTKPRFYELNAAHEVLHVLLAPVDRAIAELTEPARTLMDDALHSALECIASVLTSTPTLSSDDELGERVPWEDAHTNMAWTVKQA